MIETRFTKRVGCTAPIQLAAMPGISTTELVVAVCAAGGLGMLPAAMLSPAMLEQVLDELRRKTTRPFGVGFLVPFLDRRCVTIAAARAPLVEFFYGHPDAQLVQSVHELGAQVSWQVGSLAEAVAAEQAGCDLVVAQGTAAGGHVRGRTSLLPLLSQVLKVVRIPVLAAGGIATGRDLAAALTCGAAGVRMGTRFVASAESGAHPTYIQSLLEASAADTCITETFSEMWPNAPHRVLRSCITAAEASTADVIGEIPLGEQRIPIRRLSVICPTSETRGHIEAMALYAGESVAHVHAIQPAGQIITELISEAKRALETGSAEHFAE